MTKLRQRDRLPSPESDHKYGWRWLLHVTDPSLKRIELQMLNQSCGEVNGSTADIELRADEAHNNTSSVFLGSRRRAREWRKSLPSSMSIQQYALLPTRQPRVVIPLQSRAITRQGLALHQPGRRLQKLIVKALRLALLIPQFPFPIGKRLTIARAAGGRDPVREVQANAVALYLGNALPERKTTVLLMNNRGEADRIIKCAMNPTAIATLAGEVEMLRFIQGTKLAAFTPRIVYTRSAIGRMDLCQEYRPRCYVKHSTLSHSVIGCLIDMSLIDRRLTEISAIRFSSDIELLPLWESQLNKLSHYGGVWQHLAHGDFAPWNMRWTKKGLFVFDWETGTRTGLALSDAFYHVLAPAIFVKRTRDLHKLIQSALDFGNQIKTRCGFDGMPTTVYLILFLIDRINQLPNAREMLALLINDESLLDKSRGLS